MVDLAKIRKKKNKGNDAAPPPEPAPPEFAPPTSEPARPEPAPPEPATVDTGTAPTADAIASAPDPGPSPRESKLDRFKQQAGKRRETAAAAAVEETATAATLELLTFTIAREQYAVDIERIVEIVTPRPVTRIPNADPSVVGIMSLRGTIVTLVDVRRKLRHGAAGPETPDTRIVVIDFHNEMIGFAVDRVLRVVKAASGDIEPHPVVHATELDESIRGVFRAGGALTILVDLDKLLDSRALATSA